MNVLPPLLTTPSLVLTMAFIAFIGGYQVFRAIQLAKQTQSQLDNVENKLSCLEKSMGIHTILNLALINSCQTKNTIELCNLLLESCVHKSDILTAKAIENSLHIEINNAVTAIKTLEEKRVFLEVKIREAFETVKQKMLTSDIEPCLPYAQILLEESCLEFACIDRMKQGVLKVSQVLEGVLLKI